MAVLLGAIAGGRGVLSLLMVLLPAAALVVVAHPAIGMLLVAATIPVENVVVFSGGVTATKLLGMFVFGAWLLQRIFRRESWQPIVFANVVKASVLIVSLAAVSVIWARYPSDTSRGLVTLALLFGWSLMVLDLADSWVWVGRLVTVLVIAAFVAALLTIGQYLSGDVRRAGDDVAGGVNNTAALLVTIVPWAFYLVRSRAGLLARFFGLSYVALTLVAVAVTFSRMSLVLLPLVILVQYWETIRGRSGRGWLILLTGIIVLVAATLVPLDLVQERVQTIVPYVQSTVEGDEETPTSGRGFHFRVGLAMFLDYPILGVGYNNYGRHFLQYQYQIPGADKVWSTPRSTHGSYIAMLANLGLVGFILWLVLLAVAFRNFWLAWSRLSPTQPSRQFLLVQAFTYSFVLQTLYAWYESTHQEKLFWLLLALSVIVRRLADQRGSQRLSAPGNELSISG